MLQPDVHLSGVLLKQLDEPSWFLVQRLGLFYKCIVRELGYLQNKYFSLEHSHRTSTVAGVVNLVRRSFMIQSYFLCLQHVGRDAERRAVLLRQPSSLLFTA